MKDELIVNVRINISVFIMVSSLRLVFVMAIKDLIYMVINFKIR